MTNVTNPGILEFWFEYFWSTVSVYINQKENECYVKSKMEE